MPLLSPRSVQSAFAHDKVPRTPSPKVLNAPIRMQTAPSVSFRQPSVSLGGTFAAQPSRRQPCFAGHAPFDRCTAPWRASPRFFSSEEVGSAPRQPSSGWVVALPNPRSGLHGGAPTPEENTTKCQTITTLTAVVAVAVVADVDPALPPATAVALSASRTTSPQAFRSFCPSSASAC